MKFKASYGQSLDCYYFSEWKKKRKITFLVAEETCETLEQHS
jgi:hypothetical protein